jgi:hypothetical protein
MWNRAGWFEKHETASRIAWNDTTTKGATGKSQKIAFIIVAAQREFETILSGSRPMTCAGTATVFGKDRLDVIAKAPIEGFVHSFDADLDRGGLLAAFYSNGCGAVFYGNGFALFDADDIRVAGDELDIVCDLADELVLARFFENELLAGFGAVEGDG